MKSETEKTTQLHHQLGRQRSRPRSANSPDATHAAARLANTTLDFATLGAASKRASSHFADAERSASASALRDARRSGSGDLVGCVRFLNPVLDVRDRPLIGSLGADAVAGMRGGDGAVADRPPPLAAVALRTRPSAQHSKFPLLLHASISILFAFSMADHFDQLAVGFLNRLVDAERG